MIGDLIRATFASAVADKDGNFHIDDLPEGDYSLWTGRFDDNYPKLEVVAHTGDTGVIVKYLPFGAIRGEVVLEGSTAHPADVLVEIAGKANGVIKSYRAQGTGEFRFNDVPPGAYRMTLHGPEFLQTRIGIEVVSNQTTELGEVVVAYGRALSGRVVDRREIPISGARVYLRRQRMTFDYSHIREPWLRMTDDDGRFIIGGLQDTSPYFIVARYANMCSREVRVSPAESVSMSSMVILVSCGSVMGTVVDGQRPVPHALVSIGDPEVAATLADENGAFAFEMLPKGAMSIRVADLSRSTPLFKGDVEVREGPPSEIVLDVSATQR